MLAWLVRSGNNARLHVLSLKGDLSSILNEYGSLNIDTPAIAPDPIILASRHFVKSSVRREKVLSPPRSATGIVPRECPIR